MRFYAEKCEMTRNSALFRPEIIKTALFGPPGPPSLNFRDPLGEIHLSGRKRGEEEEGLYPTLFPAPSPPLTLSSSYPTLLLTSYLFSGQGVLCTPGHLNPIIQWDLIYGTLIQ